MTTGFFDYPTGDGDSVADLVLLPEWSDEHWARLVAHAHTRRTRAGESLIEAGQRDRWLCIIVHGEFDVVVGSGRRRKSIRVVGPGEVVGELGFLDGLPASADVVSIGEGEALRIGPSDFEVFSSRFPALGRDLIFGIGKVVARRLRDLTERVANR